MQEHNEPAISDEAALERLGPMHSVLEWQEYLANDVTAPLTWKTKLQDRVDDDIIYQIASVAQSTIRRLKKHVDLLYEMTADREWTPSMWRNENFPLPDIFVPRVSDRQRFFEMQSYFSQMFPEHRKRFSIRDAQLRRETIEEVARQTLSEELCCSEDLVQTTLNIEAFHHSLQYSIKKVMENPHGQVLLSMPFIGIRGVVE